VVSFLFLFTWWQFCIVQILSGRKTFLHISFSSDVWSGIFFLLFFCFLPLFWLGIFFLLCFLSLFDREFSFFFFFRGQGLTFSPLVKVYGKLGFWLKACRTAGHGICQGLASGLWIKGMSHIISMIHKQQWWLGNFMQNWSCMHPCGHSSIKVYGHVTLRLRIHFHYLSQPSVSKICSFIISCIHPSPFWAFGKIFTAFILQVYTHFFSKTGHDQWIFFKEKLEVISFQKHVDFLARQLIFLFLSFFFFFLFY